MVKTITRFIGLAATVAAIGVPTFAHAAFPGDHPAYLHATSDLQAARWLIQHRYREGGVSGHDVQAVRQIDAAIYDIQQAAFNDGKNPDRHVPVDRRPDGGGKLHAARDMLYRARHDVTRDEDNPDAQNAKHWGLAHIDAAIREVDAALDEGSGQ
ncbi:hypothetical protein [Paraburkholderia sp. CI3]|uniref:hypothetical protein n=1 Tax=Paraburkholderia sp. CI3 TaxID=2991060 RepID=UPI003D1A3552